MAANGIDQSGLYRNGYGQFGNQYRDRSAEQSGNTAMIPQFSTPYQWDPSQNPSLGRYSPPMLSNPTSGADAWQANNNQGGYSYNLPNSFGLYNGTVGDSNYSQMLQNMLGGMGGGGFGSMGPPAGAPPQPAANLAQSNRPLPPGMGQSGQRTPQINWGPNNGSLQGDPPPAQTWQGIPSWQVHSLQGGPLPPAQEMQAMPPGMTPPGGVPSGLSNMQINSLQGDPPPAQVAQAMPPGMAPPAQAVRPMPPFGIGPNGDRVRNPFNAMGNAMTSMAGRGRAPVPYYNNDPRFMPSNDTNWMYR